VVIDSENEDYYVGRTEYDSPEVDPEVLIEKTQPMQIGQYYNVKITSADTFELLAVPVINE
jgi:ribosomal protein S12 methylthiotransferase